MTGHPIADGALRLGFIPLVDCAPVIVAQERGFAAAEGLALSLARETSWANVRDRLLIGHFDAAHVLAPIPIASSVGLGPLDEPLIVPMVLSLGGNAITVSERLWADMVRFGADTAPVRDPAAVGRALVGAVRERAARGDPPPTFAIVHPFSAHNYELRYWLAAVGLHPDRDVSLVVVPPPFMADALATGRIDGFTVGEPWSSRAVEGGHGRIITSKAAIWRQGPEKVLCVRAGWAATHPDVLAALMRAVARAAAWADDPANRDDLADLLAQPAFVGVDRSLIARALSHQLVLSRGAAPVQVPDFLLFDRAAATFPWQSHALWFYTQMVRWGHVPASAAAQDRARLTYRPDLYRKVLGPIGVPLPNASMKVEGALAGPTPVASSDGRMVLGPDGFFDGRVFDPDDVDAYLRDVALSHARG